MRGSGLGALADIEPVVAAPADMPPAAIEPEVALAHADTDRAPRASERAVERALARDVDGRGGDTKGMETRCEGTGGNGGAGDGARITARRLARRAR
jgi:hypothetical protein